jgi:hypothetical protein
MACSGVLSGNHPKCAQFNAVVNYIDKKMDRVGIEPTTPAKLRKTAVVQKQLQKSHYRSTIILFSASRPSYVNNAMFNKSIAMTPE